MIKSKIKLYNNRTDMIYINDLLVSEPNADMINLHHNEFVTIWDENKYNKIIGCGRIIQYVDCDEIASIVIEKKARGLGIGQLLIKSLINRYTTRQSELFLMCSPNLENFYKRLGFEKCDYIPKSLIYKHEKYSDGLTDVNNDNNIIMTFICPLDNGIVIC